MVYSIAQIDSSIGVLKGITMPNTIQNLNTLGASVSYFNTEYQSYVQNNNTNITTLNNLGTSHTNRLNTDDTNIFNIGTTFGTHTNKISLLDTEVYTNHNSRLNNLETFDYGATWVGVSGGSPSFITSVQKFSDDVQFSLQILQGAQIAFEGYQAYQNGTFSTFIANQVWIQHVQRYYKFNTKQRRLVQMLLVLLHS